MHWMPGARAVLRFVVVGLWAAWIGACGGGAAGGGTGGGTSGATGTPGTGGGMAGAVGGGGTGAGGLGGTLGIGGAGTAGSSFDGGGSGDAGAQPMDAGAETADAGARPLDGGGSIQFLSINTNDLVFDPKRGVLYATTNLAPNAGVVLSIDPVSMTVTAASQVSLPFPTTRAPSTSESTHPPRRPRPSRESTGATRCAASTLLL